MQVNIVSRYEPDVLEAFPTERLYGSSTLEWTLECYENVKCAVKIVKDGGTRLIQRCVVPELRYRRCQSHVLSPVRFGRWNSGNDAQQSKDRYMRRSAVQEVQH